MGELWENVLEFVRLFGRLIVGGSSEGGRKLSRAERKAQGAVETLRARRELRAGSALVVGVLLIIVAAFMTQALGFGSGVRPQHIEALDLTDGEAMRRVLFGAKPWVIECTSQSTGHRSMLRKAAAEQRLPEGLGAASVTCTQPLRPGGPSLLERFDLRVPEATSDALPPLLLAGHGLPSPIVLGSHSTSSSLARYLKRWSQPRAVQLNSTLDLRRHCLGQRPACLLLLTSSGGSAAAKTAVQRAIGTSHRELGFATLNKRTHGASFASQIPDTSRAVLIALRATPSTPLGAEARAFRGVVSSENHLDLDAFVATAARGGAAFTQLDAPPRILPVGTVPGVDLANEELHDPLLSNKRYERESAL